MIPAIAKSDQIQVRMNPSIGTACAGVFAGGLLVLLAARLP